jgi:hypothetical protein
LLLRLDAQETVMRVVLKIVCAHHARHKRQLQDMNESKQTAKACESTAEAAVACSSTPEPKPSTDSRAHESSVPTEVNSHGITPQKEAPSTPPAKTPPKGSSRQRQARTSTTSPGSAKEKRPVSAQMRPRGSLTSVQSKNSSSKSPPRGAQANDSEEISKPQGAPRGRPLALRRGKTMPPDQAENLNASEAQRSTVIGLPANQESLRAASPLPVAPSPVPESHCAEADQEGETSIDAVEPDCYEVSEDEFERLMQAGIFRAPCSQRRALPAERGTGDRREAPVSSAE